MFCKHKLPVLFEKKKEKRKRGKLAKRSQRQRYKFTSTEKKMLFRLYFEFKELRGFLKAINL